MSKVTVKDPLEILDSEHEVAQSQEAITISKDDRERREDTSCYVWGHM